MTALRLPKGSLPDSEDFFASDAVEGPLLNENELKSVLALISYASNEKRLSEGIIRTMVATHFTVVDITDLRAADYEDVIRFLVDFGGRQALN